MVSGQTHIDLHKIFALTPFHKKRDSVLDAVYICPCQLCKST